MRSNVMRKRQQDRKRYFVKQKLYGVFVIAFSFVLLALTKDLMALFGVAVGFSVMTTKQMVINNAYYMEHGGADQW